MKVASPTLIGPIAERKSFAMLADLLKARLTTLVVLTTLTGFYAGYAGSMDYLLLFNCICGTALVAGGAAALNQLLEREHDALMQRTADRPLPSGELTADTVLLIGGGISILGLLQLAVGVNLLTSCIGAVTLITYLFVYTPLKRVTSLNTIIGAIPGALPPLMGWTAARGEITPAGWSLFAILFFWQLPHFLAIAWIYRDEYQRAGFVMLPLLDPTGERTGRQALCHTLGLLPISLCPALLGVAGVIYFAGALFLGLGFAWCAFQFSRELSLSKARQLFFASIIYLPLLLGLLVFDKVR